VSKEIFEVKIEGLSNQGHGFGKIAHTGQKVSIAGTWPGEVVLATLPENESARRGPFQKLNLKEIVLPSTHRLTRPCPHSGLGFDQCSGCPWSFIQYQEQVQQKKQKFLYALQRQGLTQLGPIIGDVMTFPPLHENSPSGIRTRGQFKTDGRKVGYLHEGTQHIVDIQDCMVLNEKARTLYKQFRQTFPRDDWKPGEGFHYNFFEIDDELNSANDIQMNRRRPFKQAMNEANFFMQQWITKKAQSWSSGVAVDFYAGSGNLTFPMASNPLLQIYGVEISRAAEVEFNFKLKSYENKIDKVKNPVHWQGADLNSGPSIKKLSEDIGQVDYALFDPPRTGLTKKKTLFKQFNRIKEILYVGCEKETAISDWRFFLSQGYQISELKLVDQFPHTPHLEMLAHFRKMN